MMKTQAMILTVLLAALGCVSSSPAEPTTQRRIEIKLHAPKNAGFLGVVLSNTDGDGVLVAELMVGSPAEKAGLMAGDRITAVDDEPVADADALARAIRGRKPATNVKLTLVRDGKQKTVTVKLGSIVEAKPFGGGAPLPRPPRPAPRWMPYPVPKFPPVIPHVLEQDGVRVLIWGLPPAARKQLEGKIRQWVKQLKAAQPKQAYLGVGIARAAGGLRVRSVDLDSPAGKVGVRAGDLIVRLDEMTADDPAAFVKAVGAKKPGDTVTLVIHRGKLRTELLVTLAEKPKRPRSLLAPPWPGRRFKDAVPGGGKRIFRWKIRPGEPDGMEDLHKQLREALKQQGGVNRKLREQILEHLDTWLEANPQLRELFEPDAWLEEPDEDETETK